MISLECLIALFLIGAGLLQAAATAAPPSGAGGLAVPLSDVEAWKRLPAAEKGGGQPLPSWARMLAGELPRTTAAFLQLDFAQRTKGPVDPKLRAAMRWVAAHANRCAYAEAYAGGRCPPRRARRGQDRSPGTRKLPRLARRRAGRPGVRPQDDPRFRLGHRRRVRCPGQGLRRKTGRVDGSAPGLRQLPGPPVALPWRDGRAGRPAPAGGRGLRPNRLHGPADATTAPAEIRPCPNRRARTWSRTTRNGPRSLTRRCRSGSRPSVASRRGCASRRGMRSPATCPRAS